MMWVKWRVYIWIVIFFNNEIAIYWFPYLEVGKSSTFLFLEQTILLRQTIYFPTWWISFDFIRAFYSLENFKWESQDARDEYLHNDRHNGAYRSLEPVNAKRMYTIPWWWFDVPFEPSIVIMTPSTFKLSTHWSWHFWYSYLTCTRFCTSGKIFAFSSICCICGHTYQVNNPDIIYS